MKEMNEITIPKGVDRIAVKQHEDKIVIEFIHEELKKGDLAIFWNEETLPDGDAIIARYNCADIIDCVISHHSSDGGVYNFAVKWDGTKEQFEKILRGGI